MLRDSIPKTVYYLRARRGANLFDLQAVVEKARKKKKTCDTTEVTLGDGDVVRIQHYSKSGGRARLHLSRYIPGVQASTLQPKATTVQDDEGTQPPPKGKEFKDGDCFLIIKEHHVIFCGHGITKSKATLYLSQLFRAAELHDEASGYDLVPISNLDKLKLIQDHGVKSIELGAGAFDLSLPKQQRTNWITKTFGKLGDELEALVGTDQSLTEQKALEDLIVSVQVRLDGNTRAIESSKEFIEDLAETVLDNDDSLVSKFIITTQDGERITASDIRLQTRIKVTTKDNSVSHNNAWEGMEAYFHQIAQGNLLEQ